MKAALYARVSTKDRGQDVENQFAQMRRYAESRGWETIEYTDHDSGAKSARPAIQRMMTAASMREVDIVLVWALDRLTREGVAETFAYIQRLLSYGVQFESLTEPHFRTTGPAGELMIAIAAWIAKQERQRLSERTKAGLARARQQGRTGGRPTRVFRRDLALEMRRAGKSWREIGRILGIPHTTIRAGCTENVPEITPIRA